MWATVEIQTDLTFPRGRGGRGEAFMTNKKATLLTESQRPSDSTYPAELFCPYTMR